MTKKRTSQVKDSKSEGALPFVTRIRIQNYKSIGKCNVELKPFTLLVGLNGAGKSNFLDAFRFVADSLRNTVEHALRDRGGINEVRQRSGGHPKHFGVSMDLNLPDGSSAYYAFKIGALQNGGFVVTREECHVLPAILQDLAPDYFVVEEGRLKDSSNSQLPKRIEPDRLMLLIASGLGEFRPLYDALSGMGFYNLNPEKVRDLQDVDPGELLLRDGRNLAAVVRRLRSQNPVFLQRIVEYMRTVVPGVFGVEPKPLGPKETLEFSQMVPGANIPWKFLAANMSDGTLRVLGVLVAVSQAQGNLKRTAALIGIEEPEVAIHPGAAVKLMDALLEAKHQTQLLITTHSPDLLTHPGISPENILAVANRGGESIIAPVDSAAVQAIVKRLYTAGELLRMGQLEPNRKKFEEATRQMGLFRRDG